MPVTRTTFCTRLLALSICFAAPLLAQYVQQGGKQVPTGAVGLAGVGTSVAVSADGNTMIVGAEFDDNGAGAAWIYTKTNGVFVQQGPKLVGAGATGTAKQGSSVALSADGNTAIVGGFNDNDGTGAIWVYTRSGGVWTQQGPKLWGTVLLGIADQGISIAVSADGNTALVGGDLADNRTGAAWVFTRTNGVWGLFPDKLTGSGSVGESHQGLAVALSADGNTAVIGGPADNANQGAAWIWARVNGVWTQQGGKMTGAGATAGATYGGGVALSADGNTAMVGGSGDTSNSGALWAYTRAGGQWNQQGGKIVGDAAPARYLGQALSLSTDGNVALAGAPGNLITTFGRKPTIGAAYVFARSGGQWSQQGAPLVGTGTAGGDALQGTAVALSPDATTAFIGGPTDNSSAGAFWVFARPVIPVPPVINTQPVSQTIASGQSATLSVSASGPAPINYQWYQGNAGNTSTPVGANSATFTTPVLAQTTSFWVRVSNSFGFADSAVATISVPVNVPTITQVSNAATQSSTIAPNTWIAIIGLNLAPAGDTRSWAVPDFVNGQMPTQLDGVAATVNGRAAYVSYISPTQVNVLTPPDAIQGPVQVQLTRSGVVSPSFTVNAQAVVPSFFVISGGPYAAAEHANGSYLGPAGLFTPAKPGEVIVLYGNGFGPATTPVVPGSAIQSGLLATPPVIVIGGVAAAVQFAGLVFPGEYQFNVVVPPNLPDGDATLTAVYAGLTTQSGVFLPIAR